MRENNSSAWPFAKITDSEGLDIESIFGKPSEGANQENPFEVPAAAPAVSCLPAPVSAPVTAPAAEAIRKSTRHISSISWEALLNR